jgi:hypothetical protein
MNDACTLHPGTTCRHHVRQTAALAACVCGGEGRSEANAGAFEFGRAGACESADCHMPLRECDALGPAADTDGVFSPRKALKSPRLFACHPASEPLLLPSVSSVCRPNLVLDLKRHLQPSHALSFTHPVSPVPSVSFHRTHKLQKQRPIPATAALGVVVSTTDAVEPPSTAGRPSRLVTATRRSACNVRSRFSRRLNSRRLAAAAAALFPVAYVNPRRRCARHEYQRLSLPDAGLPVQQAAHDGEHGGRYGRVW